MIQANSIMVAGGGRAKVGDNVVYRTAMLNVHRKGSVAPTHSEEAAIE